MGHPSGTPTTTFSGKIPEDFLDEKFDAQSDPAMANKIADSVQREDPGEAPDVPLPGDNIVQLPGGLVLPDGTTVREVEIRELTGADEEALARGQSVKNVGRFVSTLVSCGTVKVGGQTATQEMLDNMLMGDRNFLVLHIRRLTYGEDIEFNLKCPGCATEFSINYSLLNDVPVKSLKDPKDRIFEVPLRHGGSARLRLPSGSDQEAVLDQQGLTTPESNTVLLGRCLIELNGVDFVLPSMAAEAARNLGIADRQTLLKEINDRQPGPRYEEVTQDCPRCASEFPLVIDLADLFRGA